MYRYRTLILTLLVGTLANVLCAFSGSLLIRTALLEFSLLVFFLTLFAKRSDKKDPEKTEHHDDLKILL